jgi:CRISPR-associated protein Cmr3
MLFRREPRLGIARDNRLRTAAEGMLYQTAHIRPHPDLAIEIEVAGLPEGLHPAQGSVRLGGEGRAARFAVCDAPGAQAQPPTIPNDAHGLILMLLTPLAVAACAEPLPLPGFVREETAAGTRWRGRIGDIPLTLHCAVLGRSLRQGGWDLVARGPRPVRTLIPPGSLFYVTLDEGDPVEAVARIDQARLGEAADIALGRGQLIAGIWPRDESHTETR